MHSLDCGLVGVLQLTVARQETLKNVTKFSQLYLVDLAGSEKVQFAGQCSFYEQQALFSYARRLGQVWKTGAEGKRLDEAKFINKVRMFVVAVAI